jgi:predicted SprT family Zn-dependent metalloprotease
MNHYQIESQALAIREEIVQRFPQHMDLLRNVRMRASNRTTRALGVCRFKGGKPFEIVLSHNAFQHEANVSEFRDTVLHEIAHAIAGHKAGHGPAWKMVARMIGAKPQRCSNGLAVSPVQYVTIACYVCQGDIKASTRQAAKAKRGTRYRHTTCRPQGVKFYNFS